MTDLTNKMAFTRTGCRDIKYSDINFTLSSGVKFDLFDNDSQVATLITNNSKTCGVLGDNLKLSMKRKWTWKNKWWFTIYDNNEHAVATIYVHRPVFFRANTYEISFADTNTTYLLAKRRRREFDDPLATFQYDLIQNTEIRCTIINLKKTPWIYTPTNVDIRGTINFDNTITQVEILCFLQLINIEIDLEFDI